MTSAAHTVERIDARDRRPVPGIRPWNGVVRGTVVDHVAWIDAGCPCQICGLPGGH